MNDDGIDLTAANPYVAPTAIEPFDGDIDDSEASYLRAFVGRNSDYYFGKWSLNGDGDRAAGFNWAAFLLCILWIGYRKMYLVAAIFAGIIIAETFLEEIFLFAMEMDELPAMWNLTINMVIAVVCGAFANRWYLWHARRQIDQIRAQGLQVAAAKRALMKRGGTSVLAAIGILLLYTITVIFVFILLELVLYGPEGFML